MVRRSRRQQKRFRCGHRGFGRFCHRCIRSSHQPSPEPTTLVATPQSQIARRWKTTKQAIAKRQWQQSFTHDPIDLTHLPKPIVIKTRRILASLNQGMAPGQLQGKRFNFDRTLLRIPVSYRYRLLCRWQAGKIIPLQVLTHEAYNAIARNKKRLTGS